MTQKVNDTANDAAKPNAMCAEPTRPAGAMHEPLEEMPESKADEKYGKTNGKVKKQVESKDCRDSKQASSQGKEDHW